MIGRVRWAGGRRQESRRLVESRRGHGGRANVWASGGRATVGRATRCADRGREAGKRGSIRVVHQFAEPNRE